MKFQIPLSVKSAPKLKNKTEKKVTLEWEPVDTDFKDSYEINWVEEGDEKNKGTVDAGKFTKETI